MSQSDYERIVNAITFLQEQQKSQPSLADVAAHVHLSEHHFQRMFSRWAGTSPKRLLQVLTLEHAKQILDESSAPILEVSQTVGLSSSSRLYDHFVTLDAVTPDEYRKLGAGLSIEYGWHPTPFGDAFIAVTERGICRLEFATDEPRSSYLERLEKQWQRANISDNAMKTGVLIERLFSKEPHSTNRPLSLFVQGTNFQINVWRALLSIQPGHLSSYGQIASAIEKPKAVRAVGTAVGANPVSMFIPCHRVIQRSGAMGGYRWGLARKKAMLALELAD